MIVDLVETGRTLRENGLTVIEEIAESTEACGESRELSVEGWKVARLVNALKSTL